MNEEDSILLVVTEEDKQKFKRLDQYLVESLPDFTRSVIKKFFDKNLIESQSKLELKKMPAVGTEIEINIPTPTPVETIAEDIPLKILYEDDFLIFVNKPAGMVVHPAAGHSSGTLVNALLYHCRDLKGIGQERRPGIVHRLDKGTSGVMVVAKEQKCHEELVIKFSNHDLTRRYQALLVTPHETCPLTGTIKTFINRSSHHRQKMTSKIIRGKEAITHYKVLQKFEELTHMELTLETGRTHQIRVHMTEVLKSPLLCDPLYGSINKKIKKLSTELLSEVLAYPHPFLHAKTLKLTHPMTSEELEFTVPPPVLFQKVLDELSTA